MIDLTHSGDRILRTIRFALEAIARRRRARPTPIVPSRNVAGRALVTTIAIMTFLASLTVGAVTLVSETAAQWQNDISREITVQIIPRDGLDMDAALSAVETVARETPGVTGASRLDDAATSRLLEPWLGEGLQLSELPVPRLVVIAIDTREPPDFEALGARLAQAVPQAELDDHRAWVSRLVAMANAMIITGIGVLVLVLLATALTVVFGLQLLRVWSPGVAWAYREQPEISTIDAGVFAIVTFLVAFVAPLLPRFLGPRRALW